MGRRTMQRLSEVLGVPVVVDPLGNLVLHYGAGFENAGLHIVPRDDGGRFSGQVDRHLLDARHLGKCLLDPAHAGRAGHAVHIQGDLSH